MSSPLFRVTQYLLIAAVLVALGYGIWYSIEQYNLTKENITVCSDKGCIRTMHIHADLDLTVCGKKIHLPRETGPLNGLHTHKEKNYLHFHDKIPLIGSGELVYDKRLSLGEIFDIFQIDPVKLCGKSAEELSPTLLVNEKPRAEGLRSMWGDGDEIHISYN